MPQGATDPPEPAAPQPEPAPRSTELRQLNIRVPEDVYQVERLIAQRYDMSLAQYVAELVRLDAEQNLELAAQAAREAADDAARQADRLEQQMQRPAQKGGSLVAHYMKNHPR